jgi:hypothetical protein
MANTYKSLNLDATGATDDKRVKVSLDDTSPGFLEEKVVAGSSKITIGTDNPGADEDLAIDVDETQINHDNLLNYDIDQHRALDDAATTTTSLWSSQKIQDELDTKINAASPLTDDNRLIKSIGTSGVDVEETGITVTDTNDVTGINNLTIDGDLTVNGTTTSVNSDTLDVTDANVTINKGGTQASADAQDAGITVEMSDATDAQIGYDSTLQSKFKIGEVGSEHEIVSTNHTQTLINKTIDADNNTVSNLETDNLKAGVLQTDISGAVSDTNLASSQAIVTYVTDQLALQDEASEISYNPASNPETASTDVQGALDDVGSSLNTVSTNLAAHLNADPSKHNADQINVTPAGGIAATDVQAALEELDTEKYNAADFDGDFDTRLATKSTTDLAEGTNLYYTEARVSANADVAANTAARHDAMTLNAAAPTQESASLTGQELTLNQATTTTDGVMSSEDKTKLDGIEALADVTDATNVAAAGATMDADTSLVGNGYFLDEDDMVSDDATKVPSQQSVKAYVDNSIAAASSDGDLSEGSQAIAESAAGANVVGFAFANATVRSFRAQVSVEIDATADLFEEYELHAIQKGSGWEVSVSSIGDDSLIDFDVDATGQVVYSSSTYAGFLSGTIKYRATVTTK